MKIRFIGILLFFTLLAPSVIIFGWLQHRKHEVKSEIKWKMIAGIDRSKLEILTFTLPEAENQLRWKHCREFEYKGEMYDVVQKEVHGDSVTYWCWWDHEETKLNRQLSALVNNAFGDDPQQKQKNQRLVQFFKSLYLSNADLISSLLPSDISKTLPPYRNLYASVSSGPDSPPPKSG